MFKPLNACSELKIRGSSLTGCGSLGGGRKNVTPVNSALFRAAAVSVRQPTFAPGEKLGTPPCGAPAAREADSIEPHKTAAKKVQWRMKSSWTKSRYCRRLSRGSPISGGVWFRGV